MSGRSPLPRRGFAPFPPPIWGDLGLDPIRMEDDFAAMMRMEMGPTPYGGPPVQPGGTVFDPFEADMGVAGVAPPEVEDPNAGLAMAEEGAFHEGMGFGRQMEGKAQQAEFVAEQGAEAFGQASKEFEEAKRRARDNAELAKERARELAVEADQLAEQKVDIWGHNKTPKVITSAIAMGIAGFLDPSKAPEMIANQVAMLIQLDTQAQIESLANKRKAHEMKQQALIQEQMADRQLFEIEYKLNMAKMAITEKMILAEAGKYDAEVYRGAAQQMIGKMARIQGMWTQEMIDKSRNRMDHAPYSGVQRGIPESVSRVGAPQSAITDQQAERFGFENEREYREHSWLHPQDPELHFIMDPQLAGRNTKAVLDAKGDFQAMGDRSDAIARLRVAHERLEWAYRGPGKDKVSDEDRKAYRAEYEHARARVMELFPESRYKEERNRIANAFPEIPGASDKAVHSMLGIAGSPDKAYQVAARTNVDVGQRIARTYGLKDPNTGKYIAADEEWWTDTFIVYPMDKARKTSGGSRPGSQTGDEAAAYPSATPVRRGGGKWGQVPETVRRLQNPFYRGR